MNEKQQKLLDYYGNLIDRLKNVDRIQVELDKASTVLNEESIQYLQTRLDKLRFGIELEKINVYNRLSKP
jgi:hypothetical protein